jgi:hypothetical protein
MLTLLRVHNTYKSCQQKLHNFTNMIHIRMQLHYAGPQCVNSMFDATYADWETLSNSTLLNITFCQESA